MSDVSCTAWLGGDDRPTAESQHHFVPAFGHFGGELHVDRAFVARVGAESPDRRRTGTEGGEVLEIQRSDEAIDVDPSPKSLGKDVPIHRQFAVQVRA